MTAGPDGALWVTNQNGNSIERFNTATGKATSYTDAGISIPGGNRPYRTRRRLQDRGAGLLEIERYAPHPASLSKPRLPTVRALQDATRANVENNMATLLIVGGLALVLAATILFTSRPAKRGTPERGWLLAGFFAAALAWLGGLIAFAISIDWLAGNAHYIAAGGLLTSILLVAVANAHRRPEKPSVQGIMKEGVPKSLRRYPYTWAAIAMLVVAGILISLWLTNVISLFWVEILVALMFVIFWTAQTIAVELEARTP